MSFYEESSIIITPNAYKAGTLYAVVPTSGAADMDVTRATAATRVDENGLVNYAEVIGNELTSPLNFLSTWLETGVDSKTYNTFTVGGSGRGMYFMLPENKTLKINVSGVTGSVQLRYRTTTGGAGTVLGDFDTDLYLTTTNATTNIYLRATGAGTVSVTDVSVKEVIRDNVPRIDYTGGGCPHILAEPQRENLETTSASGTYGNAPASEILAIAPDGLNTAIRPVPDSGADRYQYTITGGSYSSGYEVTYSWYRKRFSTPVEDNFVGDLKINTLVNCTQVGVTIEIASNINGYDRFSATFSITDGSLNSILRLYFGTVIGDGNSSIAYWGHQLEEGSYATSYIPTSGATVTRNQDQFSRDGISSLIGSEGVLFAEAAIDAIGTQRSIVLSDGTANNRVLLFFKAIGGTISANLKVGGVSYNVVDNSGTVATDFNKIAVRYQENRLDLFINGALRTFTGTFTPPTVLNQLNFGAATTSSNPFFGKVKQLQVYPTALSDAELTSLTTP